MQPYLFFILILLPGFTHSLSNTERLDSLSAQFLGKPYILGALGEGKSGHYDQDPLYRFDAFDCLTFVETSMALALSHNENDFKKNITHIRYQNGKISFIHRNHFTELDWNLNNQKQGYLKDITQTIFDHDNRSVAIPASITINKASWFQHLSPDNIKIPSLNIIQKKIRIQKLIHKTHSIKPKTISVYYIPLSTLFNTQKKPNLFLFNQIPNGSIVEIVRLHWHLKNKIGTDIMISHLGFVFIKNKKWIFRHASSEAGKVIESDFIEYLKNAQNSPTIRGIHLESIEFK